MTRSFLSASVLVSLPVSVAIPVSLSVPVLVSFSVSISRTAANVFDNGSSARLFHRFSSNADSRANVDEKACLSKC